MFSKIKYKYLIIACGALVILLALFFKSGLFEKTINFSSKSVASLPSFLKVDPPPLILFGKKELKGEPYPVKAVYLTAYTAASSKARNRIIDLIKRSELNSVVIDVKDYSGKVYYSVSDPKIKPLATEEPILNLPQAIVELHKNNIYAIARIVTFQDPALSQKRPDLALKTKNGNLWKDRKGLAWMDPSSKDVWDYNIGLAKDVASFGFDEINFDYIRFPSDGGLNNTVFPFWDMKTPKDQVIKNFAEYVKNSFKDKDFWFSADVFGLILEAKDDIGIGQVFENIFLNFDITAPMVYPSHFENGYDGFVNPADHPYEVITRALTKAKERVLNNPSISQGLKNNLFKKIRPWLQHFDLGAKYTSDMIKKEKSAVYNSGFSSWYIWDPKNEYFKDAFDQRAASKN